MKIKYLCLFLLILLVLACGNSASKAGSSSEVIKIKLTDNQVRSYIKVSKALYESSPKLLEQVQSQVPLDIFANTDVIIESGFKDLEEFKNAGLVISICMSAIIQAEYMDKIQGMTKEDYINQFTEGLDDEDEFDRLFREETEKQLEGTLSELESEGLIGQNTNSVGTFVKLLKDKVGEKNTGLVLKYYDDLKNIWMLKY